MQLQRPDRLQLLGGARGLLDQLRGKLGVQLGLAGPDDGGDAARRVRVAGEAPPEVRGLLDPGRVPVGDGDRADAAVVLGHVDRAPVAEIGDRQAPEVGEELFVVVRDGQLPRHGAEEPLPLLGAAAVADVARETRHALAAKTRTLPPYLLACSCCPFAARSSASSMALGPNGPSGRARPARERPPRPPT